MSGIRMLGLLSLFCTYWIVLPVQWHQWYLVSGDQLSQKCLPRWCFLEDLKTHPWVAGGLPIPHHISTEVPIKMLQAALVELSSVNGDSRGKMGMQNWYIEHHFPLTPQSWHPLWKPPKCLIWLTWMPLTHVSNACRAKQLPYLHRGSWGLLKSHLGCIASRSHVVQCTLCMPARPWCHIMRTWCAPICLDSTPFHIHLQVSPHKWPL